MAETTHNTWSWGCTVPESERPNGDALDTYAVCPICEAKPKIARVQYDSGTMSAPAFLDIWLEDGTKVVLRGKAAKKAATKYKEGDTYDSAS